MPKWVLIKSALFKLILPIIFFSFSNADQPSITNLIVKDTETGIEIKFLFSNIIDNNNIKGWIDRGKWIVLNMYSVQLPKNNFFDQYISYPIQSIEHNMSVDAVQVSIQLVRRLEAFDIIRHLNTQEVLIRIMYDHDTYDYSIMDETEKSFIFPDPKDGKKKQHPLNWKDQRARSSIRILCDTPGLPIYVDDQIVGYSPLEHRIDVLPGWHRVGYFPEDQTKMTKVRTPKEKLVEDILRMGLMDVFVEEGEELTVALNYQSLDEEVFDYNEKIQTSTVFGFGMFSLVILLLSWGMG
tara:strand:+ start:2616 stop:3503 length:888 start_codon:yes stop_codon:yes gene_type:complete